MMRRLFAMLGVLATVAFALACMESDADVSAKVKSEIVTDRSITSASHIEVSSRKKVVTLSGTVESSVAKERAAEIARKTEGVSSVIDNLTVVEPQALVPPNTTASSEPPGVAPNDAAITSMIESKLRQDKRVAGAKIAVETRLGVVTLSGTVKSEVVKRDAMQIAEDTAGVNRVEDRLEVRGS